MTYTTATSGPTRRAPVTVDDLALVLEWLDCFDLATPERGAIDRVMLALGAELDRRERAALKRAARAGRVPS